MEIDNIEKHQYEEIDVLVPVRNNIWRNLVVVRIRIDL